MDTGPPAETAPTPLWWRLGSGADVVSLTAGTVWIRMGQQAA